METKERLKSELASAMRSGDHERRDVLRLLLAAIKQVEVDEASTLDDARVQAVVAKQAKQRRESIVEYERGDRPDLAAIELAELAIIEDYLPRQMDEAEITALAEEVIAELGVVDKKAMGQVMSTLMARVAGRADGRQVSGVVRRLLP